ncbi:uncharacterized protein EI90DRAFT_3135726 [Cantharellus anzutake]|uniref:uncharacterized protein n=1 Tax=Cantharellus anzutake TaxID=1750568 RepID=UPI0019049D0C|nr:uncharacterized protein EI90DRAFT_3135726 [Cantharellus anzutake]KAF8314837.1 hypothetical protein EI90DRAFT_3135726 [Cantharellus anzutake]
MEVWCLVVNHNNRPTGRPFKVEVSSGADVDDLVEKVKAKGSPRLDDTAAFELEVWRFANSPADFVVNDHEVLEELVSEAFSNMRVKELLPSRKIAGLNILAGEALLVKLPGRKPQTEDDMPQLDYRVRWTGGYGGDEGEDKPEGNTVVE